MVYKVNLYKTCNRSDEPVITYSNTNEDIIDNPTHSYQNGICTLCHANQKPGLAGDDYYEVGNLGELRWIADWVNSGTAQECNVRLTNDIELYTKLPDGTEYKEWTPIGKSASAPFKGIFDGDYHTITKLTITEKNNYNGLFGIIEQGANAQSAIIKNLIISEPDINVNINTNTDIKYKATGGICGSSSGTIERCTVIDGAIKSIFYEASSAMTTNVGSICGRNAGTIKNCGSTATVQGADGKDDAGGIAGYSQGLIQSCWFSGTVKYSVNTCGAISGSGGDDVENCYARTDSCENEGGGTLLGAEAFTNGQVAWYLNTSGRSVGDEGYLHSGVWSQGETAPVFADSENAAVYRARFLADDEPCGEKYGNAGSALTPVKGAAGAWTPTVPAEMPARDTDYRLDAVYVGSGLTVAQTPAYGESWKEILHYDPENSHAEIAGNALTGSFRLMIAADGGDEAVMEPDALPLPGSYSYSFEFVCSGDYAGMTVVFESGTVEVDKREIVIDWGASTLQYAAHEYVFQPVADNLLEGDEVILLCSDKGFQVDDYVATVTGIDGTSKDLYKLPVETTHTYKIVKRDSRFDLLTASEEHSKTYDFGETVKIELHVTGVLLPGETQTTDFSDAGDYTLYWGETKIAEQLQASADSILTPKIELTYDTLAGLVPEGEQTLTVKFEGSAHLAPCTAEFTIKLAYPGTDAEAAIDGVVGKNGWYTGAVTLQAPEGYQISPTFTGDYADEFELTGSGAVSQAYYLKEKDSGYVMAQKIASCKIDSAAPAFTTAAAAADLTDITASVSAAASDSDSGVSLYYFYCGTAEAPETDTAKIRAFTSNADGSLALDGLTPNTEYHAFIWAEDEAGNLSAASACTFKTEKASLSGATVTLTNADALVYSGAKQLPGIAVKLNGKTLNSGTDFIVQTYLNGNPTDSIAAGTYTVRIEAASAGAYSGTATSQPTFTIAQKPVTAVITGTLTKTYDGTADVLASQELSIDLDGIISPDDVKAKAESYAYNSAKVEDATGITASGVEFFGADFENYKLVDANGKETTSVTTAATITKSTPTIAFRNYTPGRAYNGSALENPTADQLTITGAVYSDVSFTWYENSVSADNELAANPVNAGSYVLVAGIGETSDTNAASQTSGAVTIGKIDYDGEQRTDADVVYSGKTGAVVTLPAPAPGGSYGVPEAGGVVQATGMSIDGRTLTFTVPSSTIGQKGTITVPVTGAANHSDYSITITLTSVDKTTVSFSEITPANGLVYDGTEKSGYTTAAATVGNVVPADELVYTYTGTLTDGTKYNKTTTKPTKPGTYSLTASVAESNPEFIGSGEPVTFTIGKAPLTIQWKDLTQVYTGEILTPLITFTGKIGTDSVSITCDGQRAAKTAPYKITANLGGDDTDYYTITNPTTNFTIQKAPVYFTVTNDTIASTEATKEASVTATANGSDFAAFTVDYVQTDADTYDIMATITDANYRHTDGIDGGAQKIGVLSVYTVAPPAAYTVTFNANGGSGEDITLTAAKADTRRVMPSSDTFTAPDGQIFKAWSYNGKLCQPGESFEQPASNITVTAVWQYDYSITGAVTQKTDSGSDNSPDTVVTLMLGSEQIAQAVTDENGNYTFGKVAPGVYNLSAAKDGITKTIAVTITDSSASGQAIELPAKKTNSVVEVTAGSPAIVVDKVDEIFEKDITNYSEQDKGIVDAGGEVEIKLSATVTTDTEIQSKIESEASGKNDTVALVIDLDLNKTVTDKDGKKVDEQSGEIKETSILLTAVIQLPGELQGKASYVVYREHNGLIDTLTTTPDSSTGEYIEVNAEKTQITVHAKKFSAYAVAYSNVFTVTFDANGGSVTPASTKTDADKKLTDLPIPTRSGYRFDAWYDAASGGEKITLDKIYAEDTTIFARWIYNGGGGGGSTGVTLSFETNGGSSIASVSKTSGAIITLTDYVPTREGYTFAGWYSDKELSDKVTSVTLNQSMTVYAKWEETSALPFTDVNTSDWFYDDVAYAYENELMNGTGESVFSPNSTTTRGMIVTILYRLEGEPAVTNACPFDDVRADSYYEKAITWAAENSIVGGYGNGKFGPDDSITREQMAAILYRYASFKGYDVTANADLSEFSDYEEISSFASDAMAWANATGLVNGKGDGIIDPTGNALRCEVAAILHRFCENIAK